MKIIYFLLSMLMIISCSNSFEKNETGDVDAGYLCEPLFISFQDASGNDLVKGIGIDRELGYDIFLEEGAASGGVLYDLYTLKLVYPDPRMEPPKRYSYDEKILLYPTLQVQEIKGCSYFQFYYFTLKWADYDAQELLPPADWIKIKLKCPYVFGDEAVHEIVTYWRNSKENEHPTIDRICTKVIIDGKEFIPNQFSGWAGTDDGINNAASLTVTLESK